VKSASRRSARTVQAERVKTRGVLDAIETCFDNGWTDGLPVIPATEASVVEFLDYAGLEGDQVLGTVPERACALTAEQAAISAVMAGCKREYFPIVVAATQAVTEYAFHFNHLASLASPWPLLIVNGPIVRALGMNSGMYLFGPGNRVNSTVGRALSLLLWNFADARPGGVLRGVVGHPGRYSFCIAENEDTPWTPLHVLEGYRADRSTVTAVGTIGPGVHARIAYRDPEAILDHLAAALAYNSFDWGCHVVVVPPHYATLFAERGWTKERSRDHIKQVCRRTVADLKMCGRWGWWGGFVEKRPAIEPDDASRSVYLFHDNDEYNGVVFPQAQKERRADVLVVVGGGDVGYFFPIIGPYNVSTNPVTRPIQHG
jgi:hypothetical protein